MPRAERVASAAEATDLVVKAVLKMRAQGLRSSEIGMYFGRSHQWATNIIHGAGGHRLNQQEQTPAQIAESVKWQNAAHLQALWNAYPVPKFRARLRAAGVAV